MCWRKTKKKRRERIFKNQLKILIPMVFFTFKKKMYIQFYVRNFCTKIKDAEFVGNKLNGIYYVSCGNYGKQISGVTIQTLREKLKLHLDDQNCNTCYRTKLSI